MMRQNRQKQEKKETQAFYNPGSRKNSAGGNRKTSQSSRVATMAIKDALNIFGAKSPTNDAPEDAQRQSPLLRSQERRSPLGEHQEAREVPKNVVRFPTGPTDITARGFESRRHLASEVCLK